MRLAGPSIRGEQDRNLRYCGRTLLRRGNRYLQGLAVVVILSCASAPARANFRWVRQPSGTFSSLQAIYFFDEHNGWIAGSRGTLLVTNDGGASWAVWPKPNSDSLREIAFSDKREGWILCEDTRYESERRDASATYLLHTADAGDSWQKVTMPQLRNKRLVGLLFNSTKRGWTFGEEGTLLGISASETAWKAFESPTHHLLLGGTFLDENQAWIVGAGGTIIRTADGGITWQRSNIAEAAARGVRLTAISFVNNGSGWVVGNRGNIFHTADGGVTWLRQASGTEADLFDVRFLSDREGWAAGAAGTILHTSDSGGHWDPVNSGTEHPLSRLYFLSADRGWAVGFGGTILHYTRVE